MSRHARVVSELMAPARIGERLELASVMERVKVSLGDLAEAVGISKTAIFSIVTSNVWPKTQDSDALKTKVEAYLRGRGATDDLLQVIWCAKRSARSLVPRSETDPYGRLRDAQATPTDEPKATDMLLAKQTLTYAASKAFALFQNPFDGEVTRQEELFTNGELRFIREAMWQAGKNGRFVAVVGESGSGKTTLLGDLEDRIERDRAQLVVIRPSVLSMTDNERQGRPLKAADIIAAIILTLNPQARVPLTHEARARQMQRMVEESAKVGNGHLLVIEEAHALSINTLKALKRLNEVCRLGRRAVLGILLLGQPELRVKLDERRADMREVVQRCEVVELPPLGSDLQGYLSHRAKAQGKQLAELIDDGGLAELQSRLTVTSPDRRMGTVSLLYPLAVNNLMTACLNTAAELGVPLINRDVVRAV